MLHDASRDRRRSRVLSVAASRMVRVTGRGLRWPWLMAILVSSMLSRRGRGLGVTTLVRPSPPNSLAALA